MAFWSSIEPSDQLAFQRWHNAEHIPERVGIAGFQRGRRYRSASDANRFLMFYETRNAGVLSSPAYLAALNAPTRRTRVALKYFRNSARDVFSRERVAGSAGKRPPPVLAVIRFDAAADGSGPPLDALLESGFFSRICSYRSASAGAVATAESSIHGARPQPLSGLVIAESFDLDLLDNARSRDRMLGEFGRVARGSVLEGAVPELHWIEFALDGPEQGS